MKKTLIIPVVSEMEKNRDYLIHKTTFQVEAECEQLAITFDSKNIRWATCNVHQENNLRGQAVLTAKKETETILIGTDHRFVSATSIPGPISPGLWEVEIEMKPHETGAAEMAIHYEPREKVRVVPDGITGECAIHLTRPNDKMGPGWYKGDFHTHTVYSDGSMTREQNLASAKCQQLDFFVATDHNILTGYWPHDEAVTVFPGSEMTAPNGHANFLFAKEPIFNHCRLEDMYSEDGVNRIIESNRENGLFSINHPFLTPWAWLFKDTKLAAVAAIELCNDPTYPDNELATEEALSFWSSLLNDGNRITGIGGSDSHLLPDETYPEATEPSLIGDPGTYIYASSLTAEALQEGIKAGHAIISRDGFIAYQVNGETLFPGDTLANGSGLLEVTCERDRVSKYQWVVDGHIVQEDIGKKAGYAYHFPEGEYHWVRVDVRDEANHFIGTTNPFYWGEKQPTLDTWGEAIDKWEQ